MHRMLCQLSGILLIDSRSHDDPKAREPSNLQMPYTGTCPSLAISKGLHAKKRGLADTEERSYFRPGARRSLPLSVVRISQRSLHEGLYRAQSARTARKGEEVSYSHHRTLT
jgi:hypothetical protein